MSMEEAMDVFQRMTNINYKDMSAKDEIAYFAIVLQMAEKLKPFADKYTPAKKEEEKLPGPQSGVFRYIDGELRRLE